MKVLIYLTFFVLLLSFGVYSEIMGDEHVVASSEESYDGKVYKFLITKSDLKSYPKWDGEFPPLSPKRAQKLASDQILSFLKVVDHMEVTEIKLTRLVDYNIWFYYVDIEITKKGDPFIGNFSIPVLLNGKTIYPLITDDPEWGNVTRGVSP